MIEIYLFDWGDTLMVDFPGVPGKMCDWNVVEAVDGAKEALKCLSQTSEIYVATGAAESTEKEIQRAFERVGLSRFISGYFCKANLGVPKGSPEFLKKILTELNKPASCVAMVGDSLAKDIEPAAAIGIKPIWFSNKPNCSVPASTQIISGLLELCE
jgi:FMN phosphatase YigB (HAD superfamily)